MTESESSLNISIDTKKISETSQTQVADISRNFMKQSSIKAQNDILTQNEQISADEGYSDFLKNSDSSFGGGYQFLTAKLSILNKAQHPTDKVLVQEKTKNVSSPQEKLKGQLSLSEKIEDIRVNAILADLAYSHFKRVPSINEPIITDVNLDGLNFPNLSKIFDDTEPPNLNKDEKYIYDYIHDKTNRANVVVKDNIQFSEEVQDILKLAGMEKIGQNQITAGIDEKLQNVLVDMPQAVLPKNMGKYEATLLEKSFRELKKEKIVENGNVLGGLSERFEIKGFFPDALDMNKNMSSFGGVCVVDKNTGEKTFALRGTRLSSWGDLMADGRLYLKKVPEAQVLDMIKFVNRNITPGEKFNITGHSLGGALSQVLSGMYTQQDYFEGQDNRTNIGKVMTFNSPGTRGLSIKPETIDPTKQKNPDLIAKFENYKYNSVYNLDLGEKILSVKGVKGLSPISSLNEHMGNKEIRLTELSSHKQTLLIEYITNMKDLSELIEKRVREISDIHKEKLKFKNYNY